MGPSPLFVRGSHGQKAEKVMMSSDEFDPFDGGLPPGASSGDEGEGVCNNPNCPVHHPETAGGGNPLDVILAMTKMKIVQELRQIEGVSANIGNTGDPMMQLIAESIHNLLVVIFKTSDQIEKGETDPKNLVADRWHQAIVQFINDEVARDPNIGVNDPRGEIKAAPKETPKPQFDLDQILRAAMEAQVEEPKDEEKPN